MKTETQKDKFVTVQSLALRLSCTRQHVYNMIHAGSVTAVKIGDRSIRISENSVEAYLATNVVSPYEVIPEEVSEKEQINRPVQVARSNWINR